MGIKERVQVRIREWMEMSVLKMINAEKISGCPVIIASLPC
jgi:hypothetical protein